MVIWIINGDNISRNRPNVNNNQSVTTILHYGDFRPRNYKSQNLIPISNHVLSTTPLEQRVRIGS